MAKEAVSEGLEEWMDMHLPDAVLINGKLKRAAYYLLTSPYHASSKNYPISPFDLQNLDRIMMEDVKKLQEAGITDKTIGHIIFQGFSYEGVNTGVPPKTLGFLSQVAKGA